MMIDFDEAIRVHAEWKRRLAVYVQKPDRSIDSHALAQNCRCALGQWIEREAVYLSDDPAFTALRAEHAKFHREAANVVRRVDIGAHVAQDVVLGSRSAFALASMRVIDALMQMRDTVLVA